MYSKDHFLIHYKDCDTSQLLEYYSNSQLPDAANDAILELLRERKVPEETLWQSKSRCGKCGGELSKIGQSCPQCTAASLDSSSTGTGWCPACSAEIARDAPYCTRCGISFAKGKGNYVLFSQPVATSTASWVVKFVIGLIGLAFLLLGGYFAYDQKHTSGGAGWLVASVAAMIAIVFSGIVLRTRWMLLALLIAIATGFSSCVANFRWHGG